MQTKIAIFFHTLFHLKGQFLQTAYDITSELMAEVADTGLLDRAEVLKVGINGGGEAFEPAALVLPERATIKIHGADCFNECVTVLWMQQFARENPDWYFLYFHCKGATHPPGDNINTRWRLCMTKHVIHNWRKCVSDLNRGYEAVGCHWMEPPETPEGQYIFAGTFYWVKSNFLNTVPLITERPRIKESGLLSPESRYEAEVILGNGPRPPIIRDYHGNWNPSKWGTCEV